MFYPICRDVTGVRKILKEKELVLRIFMRHFFEEKNSMSLEAVHEGSNTKFLQLMLKPTACYEWDLQNLRTVDTSFYWHSLFFLKNIYETTF